MPVVRMIGDVHGKFDAYKRLIMSCDRSIQIGDLGVGFINYDGTPFRGPPLCMSEGDHRFIRGNHDGPSACREHQKWIADGHREGDAMFIGGALSIDRDGRREGFDWWADEELSTRELDVLTGRYLAERPRIMVTHDGPEVVSDRLMAMAGWRKFDDPSRTSQVFQSMFEAHQPDLWIFGHWHRSLDLVIEGTRFVCLAELQARDFDL